ncbi:NAD(P)-dependent alcohol dehydrogenase [Microbacterium sp. NPDC056234]|uniref:NAD(P)-dependent alcohol dehydrogenase n=1 Tax=Microbacterium sp. NPDC056234 TaxID=3345757 RepID=UPI0035E26A88
MRAVTWRAYGSPEVLTIRDVPVPEPRDGEVRIRTVATTAHIGDTRIRRADPFAARLAFGLLRPRRDLILGLELAGTVDAVGRGVSAFAPGDEVLAFCGFSRLGGNAEYRCLPAEGGNLPKHGAVVRKPASLSFAEAAALPTGALTALKNLQKARLGAGGSILINGASGSLGTYAIQLAKHLGAEVTAVCSARNRDLVAGLGADAVVDYEAQDFTRLGPRFDVVYDAVMQSSPRACRGLLRPGGVHVRNAGLARITNDDLTHIADLAAQGALRPVIDRVLPLDDVVEAHRYVETGRKRGHVVLTM